MAKGTVCVGVYERLVASLMGTAIRSSVDNVLKRGGGDLYWQIIIIVSIEFFSKSTSTLGSCCQIYCLRNANFVDHRLEG